MKFGLPCGVIASGRDICANWPPRNRPGLLSIWRSSWNLTSGSSWKVGKPWNRDFLLVTPSELVLVFITVNNAVREARLRQRGVTDREQLRRAEAHPIEVQARTVLPEMADLTVYGARPVEDLLQEMVTWIRQHEVGQRRRLFADPAREIPHGRAGPGDGRLR